MTTEEAAALLREVADAAEKTAAEVFDHSAGGWGTFAGNLRARAHELFESDFPPGLFDDIPEDRRSLRQRAEAIGLRGSASTDEQVDFVSERPVSPQDLHEPMPHVTVTPEVFDDITRHLDED